MRFTPALHRFCHFILPVLVILVALLALSPTPCPAATAITEERHAMEGEACYSVVLLENIPVLRLYAKSETELDREFSRIRGSMAELLTPLPSPLDIKVRIRGNDALLMIRGKILYDVTPAQARMQQKTPYGLAVQWATSLKSSLSLLKSWSFSLSEVLVPLGEERSVRLRGKAEGAVSIADFNSSIVDVTWDPKGKAIRINARNTGWTPLWVQVGSMKKKITVTVKRGAGSLPQSVKVLVTGRDGPGPEAITHAVLAAIELQTKKEQGASLIIDRSPLEQVDDLREGASRSLDISATLKGDEGNDYISISKEIHIQISAIRREKEQASTLFISNNPEKITRAGVLLSEMLPRKGSARFLFHHMNSTSSEPRRLVARLANTGKEDCAVHIIQSLAGPSTDEIYSGHLAASQFWEGWQSDRGFIVTIPAGRELVLASITLKAGQIASGLSNFTVMEGLPPQLILEARGGGSTDSVDDGDLTRAKGLFKEPEIVVNKNHVIGKGFTFVYLGGKPYLREKTTQMENVGNYGVLYTINFEIENPCDEENEAEIVFMPGGGPARGIFLIDDRLMEMPMAAHLQEISLQKLVLSPYEKKRVTLTTFPQSGSNYPVRIVVKSRMIP
jgi:hypothetical protein